MILRRIALFAALLMGVCAPVPVIALDWSLGRFDPACTGFTPERITTPLALSWEFNSFRTGKNPAAPLVVGPTVFFCSGDWIVALDAESGRVKWSYPTDQPLGGIVKASPAYDNGILYFGATDGNLYALNAETGVLLWTYPTKGAIRSSPVIADGVVYFGSDDNNLYAVRAGTGEQAWRGPFVTKDDVASPPAVSSGYVAFASTDGLMYLASASGGGERWQNRLPAAPTRSAPVVSADTIYIAASSTLYAIGRKTGLQRWYVPFKYDIAAGPTIAENVETSENTITTGGSSLYLCARNAKLYGLTTAGKPKWKEPAGLPYNSASAPTVAGGTVFVGGERGAICAFSADTGNLLWQYNLIPTNWPGPGTYTAISAVPVVANRRLFVVTDDGSLHCFDPEMPDDSPPEAFSLTPTRGAAMSGSPPIKISAIVYDLGCGIQPATIELSLDNTVVEHTHDSMTSTVSYETTEKSTPKVLPDGRHELVLRASDWLGNTMTASWSFIVDNKLKPPTPPRTEKPAAPKTPNQPPPAPPPPSGYGPGHGSEGPGPYGGPPVGFGAPPPPPPPDSSDEGGRRRRFQRPPPPGGSEAPPEPG